MDPTGLITWLAVAVIVIIVVWFLLTQMSLPEPINKIIVIVLVVVVAALAISFLTSFSGLAPRLR